MIYIDNNATTRPAEEVVKAVTHTLQNVWGNPSSQHSLGQAAARAVSLARRRLARLLSVAEDNIVFTSGATEGNEAVQRHYREARYRLIISHTEHPSLSGVYRHYAGEDLHFIPVDRNGRWDIAALDRILVDFPALIAVAWASGETGTLQDLSAICNCAEHHGAPVLVDASQVVGRKPVNLKSCKVSYLTLSGHKFHAPKGVGALIIMNADAELPVIQVGGKQEKGLRGGTENVAGIVGLGVACDLRLRNLGIEVERLRQLRNNFETSLGELLSGISVNSAQVDRLPNTSNITFSGVDGTALVARLESRNILCSQTSACTSGSPEPSPTLLAMGLSQEQAFSSVRFAFAVDNSSRDIERAIEAIADEVTCLRALMGGLA